MSKKRRAEQAERRRVVAYVHWRDGGCTARTLIPQVECGGELDAHEVIPRSAWRAGYLEVDNIRIVCRRHHEWIDNNVAEAHTLGLHGKSWDRPDGHCGQGKGDAA